MVKDNSSLVRKQPKCTQFSSVIGVLKYLEMVKRLNNILYICVVYTQRPEEIQPACQMNLSAASLLTV